LREILLSGRVTRSGEPLANARLMLLGGAGPWSATIVSSSAPAQVAGPQRMSAVTRGDGSFEMLVSEPGRLSAMVEAPIEGKIVRLTRSIEIPDADTHYLELDFGGVTVTGTVVDGDTDKPLSMAEVRAYGQGGLRMARVEADGRFRLELDAGHYGFEARSEGYVPEKTELDVGEAGVSDLRFTLSQGLALVGRIIDETGRGVGGIPVFAMASEPPAYAGLARTLADGSFQISGLAETPHNVLAQSEIGTFAVGTGVSPGEEELLLELRTGGRALLGVRDPSGLPISGARAIVTHLAGVYR
jgi:hypothetical protein